ncbi:hypothetical protein J6590_022539 [Homalodisca vitripennis]|nr:hypothetical protein J6590_022539 [Homalodisca vitripennis]
MTQSRRNGRDFPEIPRFRGKLPQIHKLTVGRRDMDRAVGSSVTNLDGSNPPPLPPLYQQRSHQTSLRFPDLMALFTAVCKVNRAVFFGARITGLLAKKIAEKRDPGWVRWSRGESRMRRGSPVTPRRTRLEKTLASSAIQLLVCAETKHQIVGQKVDRSFCDGVAVGLLVTSVAAGSATLPRVSSLDLDQLL